ncbi:2-polyprenyl-6-methoxyphenol hydroxylase [Amycolatopsis arida]|uniref:2-polyprenyl-6-methoxyphenol hydroxylase n=1 Tax=Amycolatopsis arida TaxID=587909 RepID=A0A1I5ZFD3_9PSEU|nr:FAD-dependent monooxygenase [Amycolatopsis arida]TDX89615.1 2-polyprenyl-6-methoxyphenol hydroxylase-like FAD-dependent oxidoreductase [Amycolatopsis arida]SFQ55093.1 2-polyprenyl-6-methoxyphenol hydroxylase [Amycolatopsis arida]
MKVVICGAGIAGLALAQRLATLDQEVVLLEQAPGPRRQGYMMDFFGPGFDAAEAMGVLPRIREVGYQVWGATFVDSAGRPRVELRYSRFADAVGGRLVSVLRPELERVLRESLPDTVELRFGTSVTAVDTGPDGVDVTLTGGDRVAADLLVGADGIHSVVRRLVFGDQPRHVRYLGMHTAAFTVTDPALRDEVRDRFCLTDSVDRMFACYGLRDGRVAAFTVHRTPDPTRPADPHATLRGVYEPLGWIVPRALAGCPPAEEVFYDQVVQTVLPRWRHGRVTLVGDACHAVSLVAGQGASLAVAGAYLLAERLARARSIDDALASYERRWRPLVTATQRSAHSGVTWFLPEVPLRLRARRVALRLAGLPGVDRLLARRLANPPVPPITELAAAD